MPKRTLQNAVDATPLAMRAALQSVDPKARTVDAVWTTGERVKRHSWFDGPWIEELSLDPAHVRMGRLQSGKAPFLPNHDSWDVRGVLGVITAARLEGDKGVMTVRFPSEGVDAEADQVFRKISEGIITNVSVGYRIHKLEEQDPEGSGRDAVPVFRAVDWEPMEVSAVAIPADAGATFRSERGAPTNHCSIHRRDLRPTPGEAMTEEEKRAAEQAAQAAEQLRQKEIADAEARAALRERERASGIRSAVKAANLPGEFGEKLVTDGVALDKAREAVLAELEKRSAEFNPKPAITGGEDERDKWMRGVSAWLFEKGGANTRAVSQAKERGIAEFKTLELDPGQFRGMTLLDIAREVCQRSGISLKGVYDRERIFNLALSARSGGTQSTSDFATLFETALYKTMRAAYATQADTWRRFAGTDTVQDFRASNRYMQGAFGTLDVVAEGAEYKNIAIPDGSKLSISTETRGAIIALSRQALINDDMGALADVANRFGASAGRTIENEVYALLALNAGLGPTVGAAPFFDATRANISTGAALTGAALDADRLKMRQQKDSNNVDYLDLVPSILLVPVALETAARTINTAAYDHDGTKFMKENMQRNMFADIVSSPRLTGTRRYLFTAAKEAIKVVFLEGSGEGPTMSSEEGFRVDGTQWKARIDFKVNAYDPKTALTNAGA